MTSSDMQKLWHGKRYYSLGAYLKNNYGERISKISIDAGFTCPNRDGTIDTRGCIFCSEGGSGDFAVSYDKLSAAEPYIAYFQAYTCTYASVDVLEHLYEKALAHPLVKGVSIATRPDCLSDEITDLLCRLNKKYFNKFIWIELGLQTIHEKTAAYIRRGYSLSCFESAVRKLHFSNIPIIVHVILGLPRETQSMILDTIRYLNSFSIFGIKLQLLHVLSGTDLAEEYKKQKFNVLSMDEYLALLIHCIEELSPTTVIHRITGDGPKHLLLAPLWSQNKSKVLNALHHRMKIHDSYQGKLLERI